MHPAMTVSRKMVDNMPEYELVLSRANFNHLTAGCPEIDSLVGRSDNGTYFHLFNGDRMPESFRTMPHGNGHFAYIGVSTPALPSEFTERELDASTQRLCDDLERAINNSGRIPLQMEYDFPERTTIGYVIMRVEKT